MNLILNNTIYRKTKHNPINNQYKILKKCNKYFKFGKMSVDVIIIDSRNVILSKYLNMPRFKEISVSNNYKKTSVIILPKNTSYGLRIGDVLVFESEHVI